MKNERNEKLWTDAKCAAIRVGFLDTTEELHLYASVIYSAMMWGMKLNEEHRKKKEPAHARP